MNRFDKLRSILSQGVWDYGCLFCQNNPDTFIVRGSTKEHSFNLPFNAKLPESILISYTQNGKLVLEKRLDDVKISSFDGTLIYYTLSEQETLKFKPNEIVNVQIRALFKDKRMITSEIFNVEVVDVIDDRQFTDVLQYYAIECVINNQKIEATDYFETVTLSDGIYKARFYFDASWNRYNKAAVFKDEYNHIVNSQIEEVNGKYECLIPDILLERPGRLYIGVSGEFYDGKQKLSKPTLWSGSIRINKGCIESHPQYDSIERFYVYTGICDDAYELKIPNELNILQTTKKELLETGFTWKGYNLVHQYNVIAIPSYLHLECYSMFQEGEDVPPTSHKSDGGKYTFYYFSSRATGDFTSKYKFREVI